MNDTHEEKSVITITKDKNGDVRVDCALFSDLKEPGDTDAVVLWIVGRLLEIQTPFRVHVKGQ